MNPMFKREPSPKTCSSEEEKLIISTYNENTDAEFYFKISYILLIFSQIYIFILTGEKNVTTYHE